jgi:flagellar hook-length control protein FliK
MGAEAASGAGKLALPSDPGIGRPVGPDQSDASKPDDAAPELPAVAMADGVPQQVSLATTTDPVVTGAMLPRVAGEAGEPVAIRIARAARDGDKSLTLELHPADLGRVEVRLSFHADGVGVQMTLDKPETFEAFSRNRARLEQQLAQAGIDLGGGGLDLRLGQQDGQPESERRPANLRTQAGSGAISVAALPQAIRWAAQGLVDIVA